MNKLSEKQLAFVREYCVDKNVTQAAIRAGYSSRTAQEQSSRLLSKAMVRQAVDDALSAMAKKTETDAEWVRRRLKEEAEDFTEGANQGARVRAIELVGKLNGQFIDRKEVRAGPLDDLSHGELKQLRDELNAAAGTGNAGLIIGKV